MPSRRCRGNSQEQLVHWCSLRVYGTATNTGLLTSINHVSLAGVPFWGCWIWAPLVVPPSSTNIQWFSPSQTAAESVMCCISSLVIISSSTCTRTGESTEDLFCWYVMTPSGTNPSCQGNSLQRYSGSCIPVMCPQNSSSSGKFLSEGCTCNEGFLGNEDLLGRWSFAFFSGETHD